MSFWKYLTRLQQNTKSRLYDKNRLIFSISLDAELICATWPDSTNWGCTAEGDDWEPLDTKLYGKARCESLCRQHASSEGCCFVGDAYGCYWKNGATAMFSNDVTEEAFAVACTFSSNSKFLSILCVRLKGSLFFIFSN